MDMDTVISNAFNDDKAVEKTKENSNVVKQQYGENGAINVVVVITRLSYDST